jgi:hypothetical protein
MLADALLDRTHRIGVIRAIRVTQERLRCNQLDTSAGRASIIH